MDNRTRLEMTAEMAKELLADGMAGDLGRLNVGIALWQGLLDITPAGHPNRAAMLPLMAIALRTRFEWAGDLADLDKAIRYFREAAQGVRPNSPYLAGHLAQLGVALRQRFERTGEWRNMEEAIAIGREAVEAPSLDDADRARSLGLLGLTLRTRFEWSGKLADADEAIAKGREAIAMGRKAVRAGADGPDLAQLRASLAGSLQLRFDSIGARDDLNEAITVGMEAVVTAESDDPDRAGYLSNLCSSLRVRFERSKAQIDLDAAIAAYTEAAGVKSAALSIRVRAAGLAGFLAAQADPSGAAELLDRAVRLLPRTASRRLERRDQQHALRKFGGLASDAAALALLADETDSPGKRAVTRALCLLELGRGALLSQALDTRNDLKDLLARDKTLADRFIELRDNSTKQVATPCSVRARWSRTNSGGVTTTVISWPPHSRRPWPRSANWAAISRRSCYPLSRTSF